MLASPALTAQCTAHSASSTWPAPFWPSPPCLPPLQEEFLENLSKSAEALQHVVPQVVAFIAGRRLSEL